MIQWRRQKTECTNRDMQRSNVIDTLKVTRLTERENNGCRRQYSLGEGLSLASLSNDIRTGT